MKIFRKVLYQGSGYFLDFYTLLPYQTSSCGHWRTTFDNFQALETSCKNDNLLHDVTSCGNFHVTTMKNISFLFLSKDIRALELPPGLIIYIENDTNLRLRRHLALQYHDFRKLHANLPVYARFQSIWGVYKHVLGLSNALISNFRRHAKQCLS